MLRGMLAGRGGPGCPAVPEVIEGSGFFDGRQARGKVDLEAASFGGDVAEFVVPHGRAPM